MAKITQIATAAYVSGETEMRQVVIVDELGNAWELHGAKWLSLPKLPGCSPKCLSSSHTEDCKYRLALAGGR